MDEEASCFQHSLYVEGDSVHTVGWVVLQERGCLYSSSGSSGLV